jgi:predicted aspartyl protease
MAVTKTQIRKVVTKLDDVKIELLRLRADLLPEERVTSRERRRIESAGREIKRGRHSTLDQVRKEFGA